MKSGGSSRRMVVVNQGGSAVKKCIDRPSGSSAVDKLRAFRLAGTLALAVPLTLFLGLPASAAALEQKLVAADGAADEFFGVSVAVDGDTAVSGVTGANADTGVVYVFTRVGDSWVQTAKLTASDGVAGDHLGVSVAIEGDTIVAGAYLTTSAQTHVRAPSTRSRARAPPRAPRPRS